MRDVKQRLASTRLADGTEIAYAAAGQGPLLVHAPGWLTHLGTLRRVARRADPRPARFPVALAARSLVLRRRSVRTLPYLPR